MDHWFLRGCVRLGRAIVRQARRFSKQDKDGPADMNIHIIAYWLPRLAATFLWNQRFAVDERLVEQSKFAAKQAEDDLFAHKNGG